MARTPAGTPATRLLQKAGVDYEVHPYHVDPRAASYAEEAAAALGVDPGIVFKTLVAQVDGGPVLTLVPTDAQLDLKALAAALGGARAQLAEPALAERLTGYVVGGISALGTRRPLPTVADESLAAVPTVYLSAGKRGLQVSLSSADLLRIAEARLAAIARRR
ncbi:MAG: Cys-tRNA(Pro) deacylase [Actinobacteria bacterium]|nr:MAG: Cys-tRNA(Pro) deacylase [Actinomycetota bacterium]